VNALFAGCLTLMTMQLCCCAGQAYYSGSYAAVTAVPHQLLMASILAGSYGTLTVGADGSYVYVVTNDNADIQASG
jgi:hypothetical protein